MSSQDQEAQKAAETEKKVEISYPIKVEYCPNCSLPFEVS